MRQCTAKRSRDHYSPQKTTVTRWPKSWTELQSHFTQPLSINPSSVSMAAFPETKNTKTPTNMHFFVFLVVQFLDDLDNYTMILMLFQPTYNHDSNHAFNAGNPDRYTAPMNGIFPAAIA
jgi:hypothetical protein